LCSIAAQQPSSPTRHSAEFAEFQKNLLHELDKQVINLFWNLPVTPSIQKIPPEWRVWRKELILSA